MNLSGGIEQALPWNFHFRANYLRKRGHSGYTFAFEDNPAIGSQSLPANGLPIGRLYQLENSEQEKYDSLELSFENQFLKKYSWFLSYARSRALSNAALDVTIDEPIIFSDLTGRLPWDSPNLLLSGGFFPITKNNTIVYFLEWRDGFWFTAHDDEEAGRQSMTEFLVTSASISTSKGALLRNNWAVRLGLIISQSSNYTLVNSNVDSGLPSSGVSPVSWTCESQSTNESCLGRLGFDFGHFERRSSGLNKEG
jgi:hypothetical protein